jgi:antitoxin HicB
MNAAAKLLASMRRNPLDWQIGDLQAVARQNNLDWRHQKSSHCVFIRDDGRTLSVPAHRPIKPIYVRKFVDLIDGAWNMNKLNDYPFEVRPLSAEEGGGYLISFPDFAECISDGETVDEAVENGRDAIKATIAALKAKKLPVPAPNSGGVASGKFVARVPKTVHAQLATRARAEGVSLNALVLTFIAQGLGSAGAKAAAKRAV